MGMTKNGSLMSGNACLVVVPHRHHKYWVIRCLGDGLLDLETTSDQTLALERMNLVWKYVKPRIWWWRI